MADEESIFNEQIQIGLDLSQFKADLDSMQEMWDAKMSEMGSGVSKDLLDQFNLSALNEQLNGLGGVFNALVEQFASAMGEVTTSFNSAFASTQDNISKAAQAQAKNSEDRKAKSRAEREEIERQNEEAKQRNTGYNRVQGGYTSDSLDDQEAEAKRLRAKYEAEAKEASKPTPPLSKERLAEIERQNEEVRVRAEALTRQQNGISGTGLEGNSELTQLNEQYALEERLAAADAKFAEEKLARQKALAEEIALEQEGDLNKYLEDLEKKAAADKKFAEEKLARQKALAEEIALEQQGLSDEYAANPERATRAHMPESLSPDEEGGGKGGKSGFNLPGLLNPLKIAELAAKLVEVYVLWNAINTAVETFTDLVKAPFRIIEDGIKYLSDVEQKGEELSGVLASSFSFADGFKENFQQANEAGGQVVETLKKISVAANLKFDNLSNAFKVLSQNGVAQYTKDLSQVVELTEQFSALLKASGPDNSRRIASELPKLFKGGGADVTGQELTLKALGLTKDKWIEITAAAKEHGDLVQRLAPYMAPYVEQISSAKSTFGDLKEEAVLTFDIMAGEASKGVFDQLKDALREIIKLLMNSGDAFKDVINIVINTSLSVLSLVTGVDMFAATSKSLPELWQKIGHTIIDVVSKVSELGIKAGEIVGKLKYLEDEAVEESSHGDDGTKHSPEANKLIDQMSKDMGIKTGFFSGDTTEQRELMATFRENIANNPDIKKADLDYFGDVTMHSAISPYGEAMLKNKSSPYLEQLKKQTEQAHADLNKVTDSSTTGGFDVEKSINDLKKFAFDGGKDTTPGKASASTELRDQHKDASEQIAQVKSEGEYAIDAIKQKLAELKISQKEAYENSLLIINGMKAGIEAVTKNYIDEIGKGIKEGKIKPLAGQEAIKVATSLNFVSQTNLDSRKENITTEFNNQQGTGKAELAKQEAAYQRQVAEEKIRLAKESGDSELEIAKMVTAANKAKYDADIEAARQALAAFDSIADRTDARVKKAQADYDHIVGQAKGQASIDNQGEIDAKVKDDVQANTQRYAQQNAAYELARKQAEQQKPGESQQEHRDSVIGVGSAYAAMLQSQKNSLDALIQEAEQAKASSGVREKLAADYAKVAAEANKAADAVNAAKRAESPSGDLMESVFGNGVRKFGELGRDSSRNPRTISGAPTTSNEDEGNSDSDKIPSSSVGNQVQQSTSPLDMESAVSELNNAFQYFGSIVTKLGGIFDHQGVLAGVGAAAQQTGGMLSKSGDAINSAATSIGGSLGGVLNDIGNAAPLVGGIIQFAGTAMSIISDLFTRKAKEIADAIKQDFTNTMNALSTGQITQANAIAQVQQQEAQAISQLSGQKGGAAQLKTLLPQLQQEVYQLQQQALSAVQAMNASFAGLAAGGLEPMQNLVSLWQQMNQQVQAYITAGGSAAEAQNYVSLSLQNMQKQLNQQLTQEQAQSVNDALQLNQLLQQRIDLQMQYAQQEFQTVNADALERQASYAVTTGTALQQQQYNYNLQMQQLNNQISGYQSMVAAESQIFTIAQGTNALQLQGNALQLQQLQQQLLIYQQQQQIVQNIVNTGNGYLLTSALGNQLGNNSSITTPGSNIVINVQVGGTTSSGYDIATSIQQALQQAGRYSGTTTMATLNVPG